MPIWFSGKLKTLKAKFVILVFQRISRDLPWSAAVLRRFQYSPYSTTGTKSSRTLTASVLNR
jgi:hypothetical protein